MKPSYSGKLAENQILAWYFKNKDVAFLTNTNISILDGRINSLKIKNKYQELVNTEKTSKIIIEEKEQTNKPCSHVFVKDYRN